MKKTAFFLAVILFAGLFNPIPRSYAESVMTSAKTHILMEASTGRVLSEYKSGEKVQIASMTKIMLLLLTAEEINAGRLSLDENVTASNRASGVTGSVIWLDPGEVMSVRDLVKSVIIASANDAAIALAERIGGSEEAFVKQMNIKALTLGMSYTHFSNAVGFDDGDNYSTAKDVAVMSAALMRDENYALFSEFMLTRLSSVRTGTPRESQLLNTNKLITFYDGIEGLKTGTTDMAGYCISAVAKRGDMRLICVLTGCYDDSSRVKSAQTLLDYGFGGYELFRPDLGENLPNVSVTGGVERELPVIEEKSGVIVIPKGRKGDVKYEVYIPERITAPVSKNQPVGNITATLDGVTVYESYIVAAKNAEKLTFWKSFRILAWEFFKM